VHILLEVMFKVFDVFLVTDLDYSHVVLFGYRLDKKLGIRREYELVLVSEERIKL
jgi:hypothetical protein